MTTEPCNVPSVPPLAPEPPLRLQPLPTELHHQLFSDLSSVLVRCSLTILVHSCSQEVRRLRPALADSGQATETSVMAFFYRRASSPVPPLSPSLSSSAASSSSSHHEAPPQKQKHRHRSSNRINRNASGAIVAAPTIGMSPAVLPDMRFEQSYLASIRGFIHELEPAQAKREKKEAIAASRRKHRAEKVAEGEGDGGEKESLGAGQEEDVADEEGERWIEARNPKGEPELWVGRLRIDW